MERLARIRTVLLARKSPRGAQLSLSVTISDGPNDKPEDTGVFDYAGEPAVAGILVKADPGTSSHGGDAAGSVYIGAPPVSAAYLPLRGS
jgi:hypothetical protein